MGQPPPSHQLHHPEGVYPHLRGAAGRDADLRSSCRGISPPAWGSPTCIEYPFSCAGYIPTCVGLARQRLSAARQEMGISPPAWGSLSLNEVQPVQYGYIPTCVGQPKASCIRVRMTSVYPHLRGAAIFVDRMQSVGPGISPPAWGSPNNCARTETLSGYIPTCVGQPLHLRHSPRSQWVYPHLRGAAVIRGRAEYVQVGISPPAWGSPPARRRRMSMSGYIPTCVGQPEFLLKLVCLKQVYPHLRGAAMPGYWKADGFGGISPPAWGSPELDLLDFVRLRYIPTCVGQPLTFQVWTLLNKVYPHLRGAACGTTISRTLHRGISPPAWGSPSAPARPVKPRRYIPTCVGQPISVATVPLFVRVYPHLRGAATKFCATRFSPYGISPPAWGSPYSCF